MFACVDVAYHDREATAACVLFRSWSDGMSTCELVEHAGQIGEYITGEFYRRELPPIMAVLQKVPEPLEVVIVDCYVWLDNGKPGLGVRLFEEMGRSAAVIGVAKSSFSGAAQAIPIMRGRSIRPLYVTAVGMDVNVAAKHVLTMHGPYRIPTLLKQVDQLTRQTLHSAV